MNWNGKPYGFQRASHPSSNQGRRNRICVNAFGLQRERFSPLLQSFFGAFGAHILKGHLDAERLNTFDVAVRYHMFHALGLILVGILAERWTSRAVTVAGLLLLIGITLFSGGLYVWTLAGFRAVVSVVPPGRSQLHGRLGDSGHCRSASLIGPLPNCPSRISSGFRLEWSHWAGGQKESTSSIHKMRDGGSVRVQNDEWKLALSARLRRFVLSPTIYRHFRHAIWQIQRRYDRKETKA